jgi:hypothetical protein
MAKRRKKRGRLGLFNKRLTPEDEVARREAAFAAIRLLYRESLPLWRVCPNGQCRRHRCCSGKVAACLRSGWPLMSAEQQAAAYKAVTAGGPRRLPPATHMEWSLRRYPPTNFVL